MAEYKLVNSHHRTLDIKFMGEPMSAGGIQHEIKVSNG